MTAGELVLVVAAVLCCLGFTALVVVLMRVLDALRDVRALQALWDSGEAPWAVWTRGGHS